MRAEEHANDPGAQDHWRQRGREAFENGHPRDRNAVFYRTFDDGSSVQVDVDLEGNVVIAAAQSYDDKKAQSGKLYG